MICCNLSPFLKYLIRLTKCRKDAIKKLLTSKIVKRHAKEEITFRLPVCDPCDLFIINLYSIDHFALVFSVNVCKRVYSPTLTIQFTSFC